jgi:hypothetical protein
MIRKYKIKNMATQKTIVTSMDVSVLFNPFCSMYTQIGYSKHANKKAHDTGISHALAKIIAAMSITPINKLCNTFEICTCSIF